MKRNILIIGYGEIGSSLHRVYKEKEDIFNVDIHDPLLGHTVTDYTKQYDVIEICIPYNKLFDFESVVEDYLKQFLTKLVIINSTVIVGTTERLIERTGQNIVHSPVRGVHPNLTEGIKTFIKYVGCQQEEACKLTSEHYNNLGITANFIGESSLTEYLKLASTTQYGYLIAMYAELQDIHQQYGLDKNITNNALKSWNQSYNIGYKQLGMSHVQRPILYPPPDNVIGGHCVIPNAELLDDTVDSDMVRLVLKYGK